VKRAQRRAAGFSLLELLVALFVVVLVTSLVTLSVNSGGGDIRLDSTVRNLANVAGYAMDEAQLSGVDYGLLLFRRSDDGGETVYGYGWRQRRPEGWRQPEQDQDIFAEHLLEAGVELRLELEDYPLGELDLMNANEDAAPQVLLMASGETTPGALELRRERNGEVLWRIEWDLLGRFELLRRGEPEDDFGEG
jgi:type II secretion system protein H